MIYFAHGRPLPDPDNFYYLASPFAGHLGGPDQAFDDADMAESICERNDIRVYCPIARGRRLARTLNLDPYDAKVWEQTHQPYERLAVGLIIVQMPGWEQSAGIAAEKRRFGEYGKPVFMMRWPQ